MHVEKIWDVVVAERAALAATLRTLSAPEWDHPSLCEGWRVRDVAAHVASGPQLDWPAMLRLLPQFRYGYNGMILRDGQRRGQAAPQSIIEQLERFGPLRRGPVVVTAREALIDILVHTQDIVRPLGRAHALPADAAGVAADRARRLAVLMRSSQLVGSYQLRATDLDWCRGRGLLIEGPMAELLMLCAGRPADWRLLSGPGVESVRSRASAQSPVA